MDLILASGSVGRKEQMELSGIPFTVRVSKVKEVCTGSPKEIVLQNAFLKGEAVFKQCASARVLSADTVIYQDGMVLGKPRDERHAAAMLARLSGAWHEVHTGVALFYGDTVLRHHAVSQVHFVPLDGDAIARYISTGEPMGKAGAYALQGVAGMFVDEIKGSYSNVIGLPMAAVRLMLIQAGMIL